MLWYKAYPCLFVFGPFVSQAIKGALVPRGHFRLGLVSGLIFNSFPGILWGLKRAILLLVIDCEVWGRTSACGPTVTYFVFSSLPLDSYRTAYSGCPVWQHLLSSAYLLCLVTKKVHTHWRTRACTKQVKDAQHLSCEGQWWRWVVNWIELLAWCCGLL